MVENLPAAAQRAEIVAKSLQLKDTCRAERLRLDAKRGLRHESNERSEWQRFEDSTIPALQLLTKCHSGPTPFDELTGRHTRTGR